MAETTYRVRLDPWAAEYDRAIQVGEEDETHARVELDVEGLAWDPVRPAQAPPPTRTFFVDGVRRVEHRLLVEDGERTLFGLLGSFAVGATEVTTAARVVEARADRVAAAGGGLRLAPFTARLVGGPQAVTFRPVAVPENTPMAPLEGLQNAMREREAVLGQALGKRGDLVVLDGPLTFASASDGPVVGFVKKMQGTYLPPPQGAILRRLGVGERTPLFVITDRAGRHPRYSWYARIGSGRAIESPLTGVVRLETAGTRDLGQARGLADAATRSLPRFASDAAHDPRAPQNLHPVGALEAQLRHLLGDPHVLRRAIEARLHEEVA